MKTAYSMHGLDVQVFERSFSVQDVVVHTLADNYEDKVLAALELAYAAGRRDAATTPAPTFFVPH